MITIKDKRECCGCSACASVCPKRCITMCEDNEGFLYPFVDTDICIECGLCENICPVIHAQPDEKKEQKAYLVQHKNAQVLRESTSGGAFTAIANGYLIEEVWFVVQVLTLILKWYINGQTVMKT